MSSVGCFLDVRSGCCLYAASPLTYAIRPDCSARLVVIEALGSERCLGIQRASEIKLNRPQAIHNKRKQLCIYE